MKSLCSFFLNLCTQPLRAVNALPSLIPGGSAYRLGAFWPNTFPSIVTWRPLLHTPSCSLQSSTGCHFKKENKSEHGSWRSNKGQLVSYYIFVTPRFFLMGVVRPVLRKTDTRKSLPFVIMPSLFPKRNAKKVNIFLKRLFISKTVNISSLSLWYLKVDFFISQKNVGNLSLTIAMLEAKYDRKRYSSSQLWTVFDKFSKIYPDPTQ